MSAVDVPSRTDVVVIGAGISGLYAARCLVRSGVERVTVVEARDRIGGRLRRIQTADGRYVEAGGELVGPPMATVNKLAAEYGLELMDLPAEGSSVRVTDGERFVEAYPYELAPDVAAAYGEAFQVLDALAGTVPLEAPWTAPDALRLDATTVQTWIDENVEHPVVRAAMPLDFMYAGGLASELSLLYVLWFLRMLGGSAGMHVATGQRLRAGSSELVARFAAEVGDERIVLDAPVRTVRQDDRSVTVVTDRGEIAAKVVVAAAAPQYCARIAWEPLLPASRDRIQDRYLQGHGQKLIARYAEPWWRARGLSGATSGLAAVFMDVTDPDAPDATLMAFTNMNALLGTPDEAALTDDAAARRLFDAAIATYFGDDVPQPTEFHNFSWVGDPWSLGCGAGLPTGVLTTVGHALRTPVGRVVWAGAETGVPFIDWIEGALLAGERAAGEAKALLA